MTNRTQLRILVFVSVALLTAVAARAQVAVPPPIQLAPVPPALLNAKKIFISNAGADSGLFPHPFSGDPDRPYNEFYTDIKSWGRYGLVGDPSECAEKIQQLHEESGGFGTLLSITADSDDAGWDHESLRLLMEQVAPRVTHLT